jgi:hypothetical protein
MGFAALNPSYGLSGISPTASWPGLSRPSRLCGQCSAD